MTIFSSRNDADAVRLEQRQFALSLFTRVMESVDVTRRMGECFAIEGGCLRVGTEVLSLRRFSRVLMAAVGKAAVPMAEHALATLRPMMQVTGVVVGVGQWACPEGVAYFEGGHPVPDANSSAAAGALLDLMRSADESTLVLFLISGGASAMAEASLDPSLPQEEWVAFYKNLLHSGLPITKANTLRKHLSAIKGGRLALACGSASRCTLLVSDVPAGLLDVVGSGPSLPDSSTIEECLKLLAETPSLVEGSQPLQAFFDTMPETPKFLPEGLVPSICFSVLSSDSLIEAAEDMATAAGYRVLVDNTCDDWDYREAARYLFDLAVEEACSAGALCILSAGEVTVSIAGPAGRGGRNQQWALEMARLLSGRQGFVAMSVGSDGIDGNSPAAGAIVDSETWSRATEAGFDAEQALALYDAYPLFARLGDAVVTGPSGNNLRDLRVMLVRLP